MSAKVAPMDITSDLNSHQSAVLRGSSGLQVSIMLVYRPPTLCSATDIEQPITSCTLTVLSDGLHL